MAKFRHAITRHMKSFNFKEPVAFTGEGGGAEGRGGHCHQEKNPSMPYLVQRELDTPQAENTQASKTKFKNNILS